MKTGAISVGVSEFSTTVLKNSETETSTLMWKNLKGTEVVMTDGIEKRCPLQLLRDLQFESGLGWIDFYFVLAPRNETWPPHPDLNRFGYTSRKKQLCQFPGKGNKNNNHRTNVQELAELSISSYRWPPQAIKIIYVIKTVLYAFAEKETNLFWPDFLHGIKSKFYRATLNVLDSGPAKEKWHILKNLKDFEIFKVTLIIIVCRIS